MAKIPKYVPGDKCRAYVQHRLAFSNASGSLWGSYSHSLRQYAVYSYHHGWPLFIYSDQTKTWYENTDKYSRTTSKHHSQAHPHCDTIGLSCDDMVLLDECGPVALTKRRLGVA